MQGSRCSDRKARNESRLAMASAECVAIIRRYRRCQSTDGGTFGIFARFFGRRRRRGGVLMDTPALLSTLAERGLIVTADGDAIQVRPRARLNDELRAA